MFLTLSSTRQSCC